jgi:hypothetical protein
LPAVPAITAWGFPAMLRRMSNTLENAAISGVTRTKVFAESRERKIPQRVAAPTRNAPPK